MIDTHCHLNFKAFSKDIPSVVRRFKEQGGEALIIVGTKISSSQKALEITQEYPFCFAAIGIHPHHADSINSLEKIKSQLLTLSSQKKVVAIGETGLDYYQYKNQPPLTDKQKEVQKKLFLLHLEIAYNLRLPLIIHCRNAQKDLLTLITSFIKNHPLNGVFHCFEGDLNYLKTVLSLGFYLGFDGNITYNQELPFLVKETPLEKLLVETDSPYLTPKPLTGRNEPANLFYVITSIAKIKKLTFEKVKLLTTLNAQRLFKPTLSKS